MKIIFISTDRKIFEKNSAISRRMVEYGKFFEEIRVVVFTTRIMNYESRIKLSNNVFVYSTSSRNKFCYMWDAFKISKCIIHNSKFTFHDLVISCQDPFETGIIGALLKLFYGFPLHIQIHTDPFGKYFGKFLLNKIRLIFAEFVIKYSDRVRVVSERVKNSIKEFSENVDVLPIKSELRIKNYELWTEKGKKNGQNILTVCRLEKEKNLETAIEAFKIVAQKYSDAIFTIVGDGSERKSLELEAKSLELEEKVKFVGWKNNLEDYYKNADIYISTSLYEGYGISTIEAGIFGLDLVLSDTGVAGDIYKNEDSALICDALDVKCFARNILRLLEDKNLAEKISRRAKEETEIHLKSNENYFEKYADSVKKTASNFRKENIFKRIFDFKITFWKASIYARYFVCGITAAAVNIFSLYIFTDWFGIWYLYSSIIAFFVALVVSFTLQKFIVFKDKKTEKIHHQFYKFLVVAILGVVLNTLLVYLFTDILNVWYILSQVLAGIFVMVQNFILYKIFIFKK